MYDRFEGYGKDRKPVEAFSLANFTIEPDPNMPDTDEAVYLYFKGKPVAHTVIGQEYYGQTPQQQILRLIEHLRYYVDANYSDTGELHEVPVQWFEDVETKLGSLNSDNRVASIREALGDSNFNLGELKIRPSEAPAIGREMSSGVIKYDYSTAVFYKGRLVFSIHTNPQAESAADSILTHLPDYLHNMRDKTQD